MEIGDVAGGIKDRSPIRPGRCSIRDVAVKLEFAIVVDRRSVNGPADSQAHQQRQSGQNCRDDAGDQWPYRPR